MAGQKEKAMQGAGPCMTLKPLARPDRRMIGPPDVPVAYLPAAGRFSCPSIDLYADTGLKQWRK